MGFGVGCSKSKLKKDIFIVYKVIKCKKEVTRSRWRPLDAS